MIQVEIFTTNQRYIDLFLNKPEKVILNSNEVNSTESFRSNETFDDTKDPDYEPSEETLKQAEEEESNDSSPNKKNKFCFLRRAPNV